MPVNDYESLGASYLGRLYDAARADMTGEPA